VLLICFTSRVHKAAFPGIIPTVCGVNLRDDKRFGYHVCMLIFWLSFDGTLNLPAYQAKNYYLLSDWNAAQLLVLLETHRSSTLTLGEYGGLIAFWLIFFYLMSQESRS
jgi:hypothetical protein